jgi:hypothetical protein
MLDLVYLGSQSLAMLLHPGMWFKAAKANVTADTARSKVGKVCFQEFEEDQRSREPDQDWRLAKNDRIQTKANIDRRSAKATLRTSAMVAQI